MGQEVQLQEPNSLRVAELLWGTRRGLGDHQKMTDYIPGVVNVASDLSSRSFIGWNEERDGMYEYFGDGN